MANIDTVITRDISPKDDFLQMLQPFDNMASQLACAPLSINILGQLCLISTQKDFDLRVEGGENSFTHLKYPESFRASLCQVSQAGYDAFMKADSSMEKIRLRSAQIPDLLKISLKILYGANSEPEDIQNFLPTKLRAISGIADGCKKDAEEVNKYFSNVIKILSELECKTLIKQGKVQEAKELGKFQVEMEKQTVTRLEKLSAENRDDLEKMKSEVDEAKKTWKESMDNMPGAEDLIKSAVVQGIVGAFNSFTSLVTLSPFKRMMTGPTPYAQVDEAMESGNALSHILNNTLEGIFNTKKMKNVDATSIAPFTIHTVSFCDVLCRTTGYFIEENDKVSLNINAIEKGDVSFQLSAIKNTIVYLESCKSKVSGKNGNQSLKMNLLKLMNKAIKLMEDIKTKPKHGMKVKQIFEELEELINNMEDLVAAMNSASGVPQFHKAGPGMQCAQEHGKCITDNLSENAHRKVEMARANLDSARKAANDSNQRQMETQRELEQSLRQLKEFEHVTANSEQILKIIQKGLDAFARLREQWTQLIQFFQSISNLIECSLSPQVNNFVTDADKMSKASKITAMSKEVVYQSAFQSVKVAHVVNYLAESYGTISKSHLMPLTLQLFKLIILDKDDDKSQIKAMKMSLDEDAKRAHQAIKDIINQKHEEYKATCDRKMKAIDDKLKEVAPLDETKKLKIRAKAQATEEKIRSANPDVAFDLDDFV